MKKAIFILTALCTVAGCDRATPQAAIKADINEVCISGVVYLVYSGYSQGGITPKVNADFYPYTCPQQAIPN
ncbi:hypothetical protein BKK51_09240 [Rodentibacter trehalosifermentans]|uniref:Lipoprotein n=1 Tax=Rodentibacter trehalosifermentans TaxID=1908263 RepID=A0A1V3IPV5_9PAST|nr:hypothetical protein [Rodentibacter trehalosifermentans]OOF44278.1 hypothetical protein BKK51_09240 [Rodentibacter trehalosifermentans]